MRLSPLLITLIFLLLGVSLSFVTVSYEATASAPEGAERDFSPDADYFKVTLIATFSMTVTPTITLSLPSPLPPDTSIPPFSCQLFENSNDVLGPVDVDGVTGVNGVVVLEPWGMINRMVCLQTTSQRHPLSIKITNGFGPISIYHFPGLSPITKTVMPLIKYKNDGWEVIGVSEEGLIENPTDGVKFHICSWDITSPRCCPLSLQTPSECQWLTEIRTSGTNSIALSFHAKETTVLSGGGNGSTSSYPSMIYSLSEATPLSSTTFETNSLSAVISYEFSNGGIDLGPANGYEECKFNILGAFFNHYSVLAASNGCFCYYSSRPSTPQRCVPKSKLHNDQGSLSKIVCEISVDLKSVLSSRAVFPFDSGENGSSVPKPSLAARHPLVLTCKLISPSLITNIFLGDVDEGQWNKGMMNGMIESGIEVKMVAKNNRLFNILTPNNLNAYTQAFFDVYIRGFTTPRIITFRTSANDRVSCHQPFDPEAVNPSLFIYNTAGTTFKCIYYRSLSDPTSLPTSEPDLSIVYKDTESEFHYGEVPANTVGFKASNVAETISSSISKPYFQPTPATNIVNYPPIGGIDGTRLVPIDDWTNAKINIDSSFVVLTPEDRGLDRLSIWASAYDTFPGLTNIMVSLRTEVEELDGGNVGVEWSTTVSEGFLTINPLPPVSGIDARMFKTEDTMNVNTVNIELTMNVDQNHDGLPVKTTIETYLTDSKSVYLGPDVLPLLIYKPNISPDAFSMLSINGISYPLTTLLAEPLVGDDDGLVQVDFASSDIFYRLCTPPGHVLSPPDPLFIHAIVYPPATSPEIIVGMQLSNDIIQRCENGQINDKDDPLAGLPFPRHNALFYFAISTSGNVPLFRSQLFKVYNPASAAVLSNLQVGVLDTVVVEQGNGLELDVIVPYNNAIIIAVTLSNVPSVSRLAPSNPLVIEIIIPNWIKLATSSFCTGTNPAGAQETTSSILDDPQPPSNPSSKRLLRAVGSFGPFEGLDLMEITCKLELELDTSVIPSYPLSTAIPMDKVTIKLESNELDLTSDEHDSYKTLTAVESIQSSYFFLHPDGTHACDGASYTTCPSSDRPVDTVTDKPPQITSKLPTTIGSLTGHCDIVETNFLKKEAFVPAKHEKMCSIPISGMLTTRLVDKNDLLSLHDVYDPEMVRELIARNDKARYNVCDCRCKGYWIDDVMNKDYKKCSQCSIPDCPELFTPNSECTACECSTPQCKRFTTNVFGMIYFKPQVLRYFVDLKANTATAIFNTDPLSTTALSTYLHSPSKADTSNYFDIMSKFARHLKTHISDTTISTMHQSTIQNVLITPLVQGSFTAWKITLTFTNGAKKPLSQLGPLYGLPPLEQSLSSLLNSFLVGYFAMTTTTPSTFPAFVSTSPLSSSPSTQLPLFTSDIIKAGCISRSDHDSGVVATADMLHPCPLPSQYIPTQGNNTKADLLNPLWSKCDTDDTIPFINYESLLDTTTQTTSLRVRQLYPHCFDFAGVNVGKEYNIPCGYNPSTELLYSTTTFTLMLPSYTTAMLGSFVLPTTTLQSIQDRVVTFRNLPSPRFPSFPTTTVVLCPIDSDTGTTAPNKRCAVDTYGDECQYKSIISPTSMTSSPTTVNPQSYAHVQWDFMGDNTQELTIVLYSTQKKNDGQGYFVWSQLLTTVPVASLYASAQVPTLDQSKLFEMVYDAIANGNNIDLVNIYSSSTNIAIKGYFTRGAQQLITLDDTQIVEQFKFDLPMLCTQFNVSCRHGLSQYCTQNDGRCKCKPGYYDVNPTQERSPNYTIDSTDPTKNIDGSDLTCLPLCQNNGEWNNETSTCKCQDGYNGEYCQVKNDCQVNKSSLCQGDNGYIAFTLPEDSEATTTTTPLCQDTKCQCYGHWINQSDAPNLDDLTKKKPKDDALRNGGCSICALKPISKEFYKKEQLVVIADYYSSTTGLSTQYNGNEDTIYSQTYQPSVDSGMQSHPLTQQRCYITGTQPTTYDDGNCTKCQCKRGYGGDYCQLHIAYANMTYTPTDGNNYVYDKTTEVLLFNKLTEELSLSMNNFDKTQMFVMQHNRDYHWVEIGLYTGLDFFTRNAEYNASVQQQQQQQSEGYLMSTQQTTTPTGFNPTLLPTNLDSLYTQWDDLTTNFPTTPVKNQDTNDYLGAIDPPAVIQDPACFEQEIIGCSGTDERPKRASGHALLIGLVVGLVLAAILFILLVIILLWCRKNERGFWKSQKEQERDELSNFVPTTTNSFKGSTASPSMTIGTTSIKPINGDGVEMQPTENYTKTSAIQSATNHTEIVDLTLPSHIKGYKDAKGQIFYVDSNTMTTSWNHPNAAQDKNGDGGAEDYGW